MTFQKGHKINLGSKRSDESKKRMSIAQKGHSVSARQRAILSTKFKVIAKENGFGKWMLGRKHSKETIEKMRLAKLGKIVSQDTKNKIALTKMGQKNPMFGKKPTKEHRLRISETLRRIKASKKDLTFNRLYALIRNCPQMKMWRDSIFRRDNYTCTWCSDCRGGNLEAHHIKPFILILRQREIESLDKAILCEELWDINNGITLCKDCHKTTDSWGNRAKL